MFMNDPRTAELSPAWLAAGATVGGYLLILLALAAALFVLPWAAFGVV